MVATSGGLSTGLGACEKAALEFGLGLGLGLGVGVGVGCLREGGVQLRAHVLIEQAEVAQRVLAVELAKQRGDAW